MYKIQTVYLPVKVEDELPELQNNDIKDNVFAITGHGSIFVAETIRVNGKLQNEHDYPSYATHWLKKQEGYFFTPEQLNEYTANVVRQALETAAEKVELVPHDVDIDLESITNTFEETFKLYQV